ncbi:choline ABC transporter substrate-binding protein [Stappia sp. GBMRC 2046]|uniref:Choline ABC transporter substrate-binding protein n=1 Tax=Stappia sediminis TaxID=2692190 RepID=A0A7X3LVL0_9HYPH|nr:choline ABC transporter substrate-binding protein [Stappia sediminis]MXN65857.1 choline ABC transporter substrate-binding protein [Stappia sediminis]
MKRHRIAALFALSVFASSPAYATDPQACQTIRMSDPGWTDINSTNAVASVLLDGLGYEADIKTLSVPIGYQSIKNGDIDVFLGNWMPAQKNYIDDLNEADAAEVLTRNLTGAKFTLAVPTYVSEQGVTDFADLSKHPEEFNKEIYGIEPGAPANANILKMIESGDFGLDGWEVVESGEQAMLSQVTRAARSKDWIVFLAWAPHPMNADHDLTYLSGGDDYFGPNFGGAEVFTLARKGWAGECPNAAKFFKNLQFTVEMENEIMGMILQDGMEPKDAAESWIKGNPDTLAPWVDGVTTIGGEPGFDAVKGALGL